MLPFSLLLAAGSGPVTPVITKVKPVLFERRGAVWFADFGKDAYGTLEVEIPAATQGRRLTIRLGEKLASDGTIDRKPPGSVSFVEEAMETEKGRGGYRLALQAKKNAGVRLPAELGEVTPFRYAEIEGGEIKSVRQMFFHAPFNDKSASFKCDDETLNDVWELCRHSMKATSVFGVYIDGDRERLPYEADAYINMLSHYAVDLDPRVARATFDFLIQHPTWPTEWSLHMPMIAAADYRATGDLAMIASHYDEVKKLLLMDKARDDGLLKAYAIVDWPVGERDGFNKGVKAPNDNRQIGPEVNSVVNALYFRALRDMAFLADALGKAEDAKTFEDEAQRVRGAFNRTFMDASSGLYRDGEGCDHSSLHANMFPLAFGLVPEANRERVADFAVSRGMACSVYGAQYLLEALFQSGRDKQAITLMTAKTKRSWWNMIQSGSTITMEAWDQEFKPNQDWNHGWGAAPANIISRYVLGVRPLTPGYRKLVIRPQMGSLTKIQGMAPTPLGGVKVAAQSGAEFRLIVTIPNGSEAEIWLPRRTKGVVLENRRAASFEDMGSWLVVRNVGPGRRLFLSK